MSRLRIFDEAHPDEPLLPHRRPCRDGARAGDDRRGLRAVAGDAADRPGRIRPTTVMAAYRADIDRLVAERGFRSVDVVSIAPDNPQREAMRAQVPRRAFPQGGRGALLRRRLGAVHPARGRQGLRDPVRAGRPDRRAGRTRHWFDMGPEPSFVAIRFFTEPDGWVGHFTGTDIAQRFPRYEPGQAGDASQSILTDIEGTTSSISFVKDVLFPYARRELPRLRARARPRAGGAPLAGRGRGRERRHLQRRRHRRDAAGLDRPGPQAHRAEGAAGHDLARGYERGDLPRPRLSRCRRGAARLARRRPSPRACTRRARSARRSCCSATARPATWRRCSRPSSTPKSATSATPTATA